MPISQLLINTFIVSSIYILLGFSFALSYNTARFINFAHGVVYAWGAYLAYLMASILGLPLILAIPIAIVGTAILGMGIEIGVYKPLRKKKVSPLILLISSLGVYIVLQNVISLLFGDDTKSIRTWSVREGLNVLGARITPVQIIIIGSAIVLLVTVMLFLKLTKMGKAMRAVANDPELALISGINVNNVILFTFGLGSALAGIAGILVSLDVDMTPTMGMRALMMGVVAVIIGGRNSIPGIALGALLLGMAQHFGVWQISSQWQDSIAFIILLIFLLFRPQGFFGKKQRTAQV